MSGAEFKQKAAIQVLAIFVFSHPFSQEVCSRGTPEKWSVVVGPRHWWGTSHHFQRLHCASLYVSDTKPYQNKQYQQTKKKNIPPVPRMNSNYQDLWQIKCHSFKSTLAPPDGVAWHLTAIYSCIYCPIRPVTDQEIESRSLRLVWVDCPVQCFQLWSLLPRSLPLDSHTLEMPLSSSLLENSHQEMHLPPNINIYYLT